MGKPIPAPHLVKGLCQLVHDLSESDQTAEAELERAFCGETELIGFYETRIEYSGVDVADLCDAASFESVIWLLLNGELPDGEKLADRCSVLSESAVIDQPIADMIGAVPLQTRPLDLFPVSISLLSCFDPTPCDRTQHASRSQFWRILAQLPVLMHVALGGRLESGRALDEESREMSYAGRLLQILRDDNAPPSPLEEEAMNVLMICECITEMRPACYMSRLFGSTVNDTVAGLKAASSMFVSQLRNDPFMWTAEKLKSFHSPDEAEHWWNARESRVMPFGFHEAQEDPRTGILRLQCRELLGSVESMVMESAAARLESLVGMAGQNPTMDWSATRLLTFLNVPEDRISLAIGIARMVGWAAQSIEQHASGISLLPALRYAGESISPDHS